MNTMRAKPIKILHVLGASRAGTESNTRDLVGHMAEDFLNELCFLGKKGPIGEELENKGFKVY